MLNSKIQFVIKSLLLVMPCFFLAGILAAHASTTRIVNTLQDITGTSCSGGTCSLRDAITLSSSGDIIQFSVTGTVTLSSALAINQTLTINGPGADLLTLDGHGEVGAMVIGSGSSDTVTISGLTIANGNSGGFYGGGIRNSNTMGASRLVLDHMTFINNLSSGNGGAVFSDGQLEVTNSHFESNKGGNGGAVSISFSTASFSDITFINNQGTSNDGGAIYTKGSSGDPATLNLTNCTFNGNKAIRSGGAINSDSYTTTRITGSYFTGNAADYSVSSTQGSGGAINNGGNAEITRTTFADNQAGTASSSNNQGGAINTNRPLNITSSTFYNNKVRAAGGALNYKTSNAIGTISNVTFYDNNLLGAGAGRAIYAEYTTVTILNSIIGGPTNANCSATFTSSSTNNLSTGGCSGGFSTVTVPQLNLEWKDLYMLPLPGSVAIDTGTGIGCPAVDQRGQIRPIDGNSDGSAICDVGSIEAPPVGDIDHSGTLSLTDIILTLQVLSNQTPSVPVYVDGDVNGDARLGLAEVIKVLKELAQ